MATMRRPRCTRRAGAALRLLAAALSAWGAAGCRKAPPAPPEPASQPASAQAEPDIPGVGDEVAAGSSPILVKPLAPGERKVLDAYVQNEKLPVGSLIGFCYVSGKRLARRPESGPIDITRAPYTIRDPEPKELEYYKKIEFRRPAWIHPPRPKSGRYPVAGAAVILRGIRAGPLLGLPRGALQVDNGQVRPPVAFSPVNDRFEVRTLDAFSNDLVLKDLAGGETVWTARLAGNTEKFRGHGALDKKNLRAWSWTQWLRMAKVIQSAPLRRCGFYELTCRRHPWQRAHVAVLDNPYATVSESRHRREGIFSLQKVPVGTWTVEAWHPLLRPVEKTRTVTIRKDETFELPIEFNPPGEGGKDG